MKTGSLMKVKSIVECCFTQVLLFLVDENQGRFWSAGFGLDLQFSKEGIEFWKSYEYHAPIILNADTNLPCYQENQLLV